MGAHHHHGHGHDHGHDHDHGEDATLVPRSLKRALFTTLAFMVFEASAGWYANSLALLSDAAHMGVDAGALVLSLVVYWLSRRPAPARMSFGYHRAEILGALVSGVAIWVLAGWLVYEAVQRMSDPPEVKGPVVLVAAALGLGANLFSMRHLMKAKEANLNVRAAYLHLLSDSLGSVGAVVAGIVLWGWGWRPIDPIVTVVFSALMLFSSWGLVRESVDVLMEGTPRHVDLARIRADLGALPGVSEVHDLHVWSVSSGRPALSVHLISSEGERALREANQLLLQTHGIVHTTIQVEHPDRFDSKRCYDCAGPAGGVSLSQRTRSSVG